MKRIAIGIATSLAIAVGAFSASATPAAAAQLHFGLSVGPTYHHHRHHRMNDCYTVMKKKVWWKYGVKHVRTVPVTYCR